MKDKKNSYLLLIRCKRDIKLSVGKLGKINFKKGYYVYVGSAPLNKLFKRVQRHFLKNKRKFWHIDFITSLKEFEIENVWVSKNTECEISRKFLKDLRLKVVKEKFGSSDCKCKTHFFKVDKKEILKYLKDIDFLKIF